MKARTDWYGIIIFVFVIARSFEQFAEGENRRRGLSLVFINPSGKGINYLIAIAIMNEDREGERLFPKQIDHVLKIMGPFFAENLVVYKTVRISNAGKPFPQKRRTW